MPLPVGPLLGGFDAEGVLGATALQYKLVDNSAKIFDLDDDDEAGSGIENSLPTANPDSATVAQSVATDYQLMLVIDVSGSMDEAVTRPDGTVTTRMELQKAAVIAMLESYAGGHHRLGQHQAGAVQQRCLLFRRHRRVARSWTSPTRPISPR